MPYGIQEVFAKPEGSMMRALVLDKANWKRHIVLDKLTGLDPPGIKLRAAQGFDAADLFVSELSTSSTMLTVSQASLRDTGYGVRF